MTELDPTLPALDVDALRVDFPILQREHSPGVPLVFLDSTASSQKPQAVIDALNRYYAEANANVHRGIYQLSEAATAAYEGARKTIRKFINAKSHREIIFTAGATAAVNLVAFTWGRAHLKPGDVVLSSVMEHHANIVPWQLLAEQTGCVVRYVPVTDEGRLAMAAYADMLDTLPVKLVALTHMSNVLGTINPAAQIVRMAHDAGALALIDGAQSVPHLPVDVQALDVDFLVFSGHKMLGPTGIGVLYGKRDLLEAMPPWMGGGDMIATVTLAGSTWNELPYKFEAGPPPIAQAVGLGAAVAYLSALGMAQVHVHEQQLIAYALERLEEVPGLHVYGPDAVHKGGVASFDFDGIHAHDLAQLLDAEGVAVRAGHHCAQPIHDHYGLTATTRASFYLYNTRAEVDALIEALYKAKQTFRV